MSTHTHYLRITTAAAAGLVCTSMSLAQNYIEPPTNAFLNGIPIPIMKTMDQVEPRTLITSLPYTISAPGSYYAASPLRGCPASNGITIAASHVRLDLSGFPVEGVSNSLSGIAVVGEQNNIEIRNGIVCNWGMFGIDAAGQAKDISVVEIKAYGNGAGGIYVGENSYVGRCVAMNNGFFVPPTNPPPTDGIQAGSYSTIQDCKARHNKGANIHGYNYTRIAGCTASESAEANGIWAEMYCTIRDCVAAANFSHGIRVGSRCRVVDNTFADNGIMHPATNAAGISVEGSNNFIERNILAGNDIGILVANMPSNPPTGNLIINNAATKNGIDYQILAPNNFSGPVDSFQTGQFTNSNPWTNFKFSQF